jgi:hypothetical protein
MKQLIPIFLFLLPCLAWAQYPSNGNQKITLGEQTTADGLIFRGVASTDTVRKPSIDTMAYMVLDTTTNLLWHYKIGSNGWSQAGGSTFDTTTLNLVSRFSKKLNISDTATMLTPYFRKLDTINIRYVNTYGTQTVNGAKTFSSAITATRFNPTANTATGTGMFLPATNTLGFSTNGTTKFLISPFGGLSTDSISKTTSTYKTFELGKGFGTAVLAGRLDGLSECFLGLNLYFDGGTNLEYIGNARATFYAQNDGDHIFYTSTSGSAGGNIIPLEILRFTKDSETNIGYGATDNGAYKLQVNSQIFATNATIATSDIRFKENIQPLDKGLEIINKLKPVKFNFISTTENNFSEFDEIGFIAQDVEGALSTELFAKAVVKKLDEDKDDSALGLMTEKLIPILVKAMQEQQALIKALEQRIINLENK